MFSSMKMKAAAGLGGAVVLVGLAAGPAFAFGVDTGTEALTSPISVPAGQLESSTPFVVQNDKDGAPVVDQLEVKGSGYYPAGTVYAMVCDGKSPSAPGWSVVADCDALTTSGVFPVGSEGRGVGNIDIDNTTSGIPIGIFRGMSPNDQFNCLAPQDNPAGDEINVPASELPSGDTPGEDAANGGAIDPTVPSWGSTLPLAKDAQGNSVGGGSAPCTIRVAYSTVTLDTASDHFFPITLQQDAASSPGQQVPESPLAIALPVGGVVLFGAAGAVLYRRRRSSSAAA